MPIFFYSLEFMPILSFINNKYKIKSLFKIRVKIYTKSLIKAKKENK